MRRIHPGWVFHRPSRDSAEEGGEDDWTVTLYVDDGKTEDDEGEHSYIGIADSTGRSWYIVGHYPGNYEDCFCTLIAAFGLGGGSLKDDSGAPYSSKLSKKVSYDDGWVLMEAIDAFDKDPATWSLLGFNCCSFAVDMFNSVPGEIITDDDRENFAGIDQPKSLDSTLQEAAENGEAGADNEEGFAPKADHKPINAMPSSAKNGSLGCIKK